MKALQTLISEYYKALFNLLYDPLVTPLEMYMMLWHK